MAIFCSSIMGQVRQQCPIITRIATVLQRFTGKETGQKTMPFLQALTGSLAYQLLNLRKGFVWQLSLESVQLSTWWLRVVRVSDVFLTPWHSAALCHVHAAVLTQKANTSKPGRRGTAHVLLTWGTEAEEGPTQSHRKAVQQQGTYILTQFLNCHSSPWNTEP